MHSHVTTEEIAYAGGALFGPVVGHFGLDGYFDIVDIFSSLSRVPELGLRATSYHQL